MSKIIIGNQKMYMNRDEVISFVEILKRVNKEGKKIIICPSFPFIEYYRGTVSIGAQNVSLAENGAYTGEVSASQLKSLGVDYAIVGHSERREYQNETDEEVNQKIAKLLDYNLIPILCIGEKLEERQNNLTVEVLKRELEGALKDLSTDSVQKIIIAYEPIWAIGTGLMPTLEEIDSVMNGIKDYIKNTYEVKNILVLYGGSVSEKNVDELNTVASIDGYLIGGASAKASAFTYIINSQY